MKILQVTSSFKPSWEGGGVTRVAYSISKWLTEQGHEVTVYTTNKILRRVDVKANRPANLEGMRVYYFDNMRRYFSSKFPPVPYYLPVIVKKEIKEFDIVHIHDHRTLLTAIAHYYAIRCKVPYVLQTHGSLRPTFSQKGLLKKVFDVVWGYHILRDAAKVIAVANIEVEQYRSMGIKDEKIAVVPNGIDLSEFDNLPQKGEFRKKHNLDSKEKTILYLGRIHKIKGLDLLVEAFSGLPTNLNGVKLVVIGADDGYLSSLKKLIANLDIMDKILFTGPLYEREKLSAYVDADLFVLPSSYEIFGITVLEALACGTPVIVTDRCGIAEAVNAAQAGLVVPYDKEQLQKALLQMLNNDKMRLQFGEKGRLLVQEKFSSERMAEQMENLYNEIIKESKK